jgi:hypothetical protein
MKTLFIFIGIFCLTLPVFTQTDTLQQIMTEKEQRQLAKEYKEAARKAEAEQALIEVESMINRHRFVLEADFISGRSGSRHPVSSHLNFIRLDSADIVLQLGSMSGIGYNGVGGITVDGTVSRYEVTKKVGKRGTSYNISIYLMSSLGSYDVQLWVTGSGNADATVRGNSAGVLNYSGRLVPIDKSRVYKGSSF